MDTILALDYGSAGFKFKCNLAYIQWGHIVSIVVHQKTVCVVVTLSPRLEYKFIYSILNFIFTTSNSWFEYYMYVSNFLYVCTCILYVFDLPVVTYYTIYPDNVLFKTFI